jgi:hypothetical protein
VTTAALGRRWFRNAFRNFLLWEDRFLRPPAAERPVLVAASGPSLERALPLIEAWRDRFSLWALPSSLLALATAGLQPDLVVLTDPGYYAAAHLHPVARLEPAVAMPLTGATGTWRVRARILPLSQGTFFERTLCALRGLRPVGLPSFGTVAASAFQLARVLGSPAVVFAGLDLSHLDVRTHVRPNVFDYFLEDRAGRLSPYLHRLFARAALGGSALATYSGWFAALPPSSMPRLYRLHPSALSLSSFRSLDDEGFRSLAASFPPGLDHLPAPQKSPPQSADSGARHRPRSSDPGISRRRRQAATLLCEWSERLEGARRDLTQEGAGRLLADTICLSLCYYAAAPSLTEALRRLRLDGTGAAQQRLGEVATEALTVLQSMRAELEGASREG